MTMKSSNQSSTGTEHVPVLSVHILSCSQSSCVLVHRAPCRLAWQTLHCKNYYQNLNTAYKFIQKPCIGICWYNINDSCSRPEEHTWIAETTHVVTPVHAAEGPATCVSFVLDVHSLLSLPYAAAVWQACHHS